MRVKALGLGIPLVIALLGAPLVVHGQHVGKTPRVGLLNYEAFWTPLIEKPNVYITAQVLISETGTASAGMIVAEADRRNRKMTSTTSETAIPSVICTSSTDARIETERSFKTSMRIEAGTWAR